MVSYRPCPLSNKCQSCVLKLNGNVPHQPLKHITLSTVIIFRHCSLGQLLTFLIAFLSAMQCPACDRLLPKNFFADSLWRCNRVVALSPIGCGAAGHASCKSRWIRRRHGGFGRNCSTSSKNWSATVSQNSLRNTPRFIVPRSCSMICRTVQ